MSEKFRNKYRVDSARLKNYDYAQNGAYFITIVTQQFQCFFGEIVDDKMVLNDIGEIVRNEWLKTFEMRPDMNLAKGEFVIMPNHFHAIIGIGENQYNARTRRDAMHCVSTTNTSQNQFGPQSKNLASIVRGFKSAVTIKSREILPYFAWQPRFYDRIIRNKKELNRISEYIILNPERWKRDRNNDDLLIL